MVFQYRSFGRNPYWLWQEGRCVSNPSNIPYLLLKVETCSRNPANSHRHQPNLGSICSKRGFWLELVPFRWPQNRKPCLAEVLSLASEFSAHPSRHFAYLLPGTAAQHEYNNAYSAFSKLQNPPKASWKAQISGEMQLRTPAAINLLRAATVLSLVSV